MSSIKPVILIFLAVMFVYAAAVSTIHHDLITVGDLDAGRTIELRSGDTLVVTLAGDLAGGYTWTRSPADGDVLEQSAPAAAVLDSSNPGTPARIALTFEAANPGQTDLKLFYHLIGKDGSPGLKTYDVLVVVK